MSYIKDYQIRTTQVNKHTVIEVTYDNKEFVGICYNNFEYYIGMYLRLIYDYNGNPIIQLFDIPNDPVSHIPLILKEEKKYSV